MRSAYGGEGGRGKPTTTKKAQKHFQGTHLLGTHRTPTRLPRPVMLASCLFSALAQLENFRRVDVTTYRAEGSDPRHSAMSTSPLIQALVDDNVTLAHELIDAGADVSALDTITPLYAAQEYVTKKKQCHKLIRKLLSKGAEVDQPTQDGTTTLMLAAYQGDVRSAQILLDAGADPLTKLNHMHANAISTARAGGHHELAEQLQEHVGESGARHHFGRPEKVEL